MNVLGKGPWSGVPALPSADSLSEDGTSSHLHHAASPQESILIPQGTCLRIAVPANRAMATAHPGLGSRSKRELRRAGIPVLGSKQAATALEGSQMWT